MRYLDSSVSQKYVQPEMLMASTSGFFSFNFSSDSEHSVFQAGLDPFWLNSFGEPKLAKKLATALERAVPFVILNLPSSISTSSFFSPGRSARKGELFITELKKPS